MEDNKIRVTVMNTEKPKINFVPKDADEEIHLKRLEAVLEEKRKGDWLLVGEICGMKSKNAEMAFNRVYSKNHIQVVNALEKVVASRKSILSSSI